MTIQPISKSEQDRFGEFAVRVVSDTVISPQTSVISDIQNELPFEAKIATSTPDNGYGRVAYVLCEDPDQKRKAHMYVGGPEEIADLIDNLRKWVAFHSFVYYELGTTVVPDAAWDKKAFQLARLQKVYSARAGTWKNEAFEGFTGDTGYHLPVTDQIRQKANELVNDRED